LRKDIQFDMCYVAPHLLFPHCLEYAQWQRLSCGCDDLLRPDLP
jgi:hypothetical protein